MGESTGGSPATTSDAAAYKSSGGYGADVLAVADPNWSKISQAVYHGSSSTIALPQFIVFDSKMVIKYVGDGATSTYSGVTSALNSITGGDFGGGGSTGGCAGLCGGDAGGCFCDSQCHDYGDCCSDVCAVCGFCG